MNTEFQPPRFYPIIDTGVLKGRDITPLQIAEAAAEAKVQILQYRHKESWTQAQFDEAKAISQIAKQAGILFVMNDRADFAELLGAGLHIGQADLPPQASRKIVPNGVIGFSTHNAGQLKRAAEAPVNYLSLGPIFATTSKPKADPVVGLEGLRKWRPLSPKPLVAIGGITLENAADVLAAGADSVAIISGILPTDARELRGRFDDWLRSTV